MPACPLVEIPFSEADKFERIILNLLAFFYSRFFSAPLPDF
jgi:hypothetical protein